MKGYKLESVGTYLRADGMTYPLTDDGGFDDDELMSCHIRDMVLDGDWMTNLSVNDRQAVELVVTKFVHVLEPMTPIIVEEVN